MQNLHADLERCEPRVVSLLEAADWLRQANEMTSAPRSADQAAADSHARLSHLRARLTALTRMTANYASDLGAVLGYDTSDGCIRLHRVTCRRFIFLLLSFSSDTSNGKPLTAEKILFGFQSETFDGNGSTVFVRTTRFQKYHDYRGCLFPVRDPHIRTDDVGCYFLSLANGD